MPVSYSLRPATVDDYEFVYQLKAVTLKPYVSQIWGWDEPDQRTRFAASFDPAEYQIILFEQQAIGALSVQVEPMAVNLAGIYLLPESQRQGLGTAVITDILISAREAGLPVRLQVLKPNPARRLYERLGFRLVAETDSHYLLKTEG